MGCTDQIDLLIVVDNTAGTGDAQKKLQRAIPGLIERLDNLTDAGGTAVEPDVHLMVTSSDFGNPSCTPLEPAGYEPTRGAPVGEACLSRIDDFTSRDGATTSPDACDSLCPAAIAPDGDYIAFSLEGSNVPAATPTDIDGDGDDDSPAAQAATCLVPQGINGCEYTSPLENMLQALSPAAEWNGGPLGDNPAPFLREGAMLVIVVLSESLDCSISDFSIMDNSEFHSTDPVTGMPAASPALCMNAGLTCESPDSEGVYPDCRADDSEERLQLVSRYTNYLVTELRENQGKAVVMLGILGVPASGGVADLEYRAWREGAHDGTEDGGDLLPAEIAAGVTAADKEFELGMGPGCAGRDPDNPGAFSHRGLAPVRLRQVCQALDTGPDQAQCCIESLCADDYEAAMECLTGIIQESIQLPG